MITFDLAQRGRAAMEFLATFGKRSRELEGDIARDLAGVDLQEGQIAQDLDERHAQIDRALTASRSYRTRNAAAEWLSTNHGRSAIDAFDEVSSRLQPALAEIDDRLPELPVAPGFQMPGYLDGVEIHRTTGGWDGHPHMGFIHAELVHKRYLAAMFGESIFAMRRRVLDELPARDYRRIFEMGTSTGLYTETIADAFPGAELWGCDVSGTMLRQAQRAGASRGCRWNLMVADAARTGLPDGKFDLVTSFILLHELPTDAIRVVFREAFRLLEPGGQLLMTDVPPFREMTKLEAWREDLRTRFGGEPYWREAATIDLAAAASDAGFTAIRSQRLLESHFWFTMATKPRVEPGSST